MVGPVLSVKQKITEFTGNGKTVTSFTIGGKVSNLFVKSEVKDEQFRPEFDISLPRSFSSTIMIAQSAPPNLKNERKHV